MKSMNDNTRPQFDGILIKIVNYVYDYKITSKLAFETAKYCLADSVGCAILAMNFSECTKLLGPWVSGISIQNGARVIGTGQELDPIKAAFDMGTMIRWLDYNDTWLAKEWGHPSDNLGAILAVMDFVSRRPEYNKTYTVQDVLDAMIRAYEIQGVLALENSFNMVGLDHVILVKVASTVLAAYLLGADKDQAIAALSQAWLDGQALRTYRHAPNTGSRKSWAAGDATSRAVRLALMTMEGESGYHSALTAKHWGFSDVLFHSKPVHLERKLESYVMENILFKIAYPAEYHAQTAVECALKIYEKMKDKNLQIKKVVITTHNAAMRIINKTGPLYNPADRDHCLQYMVAIALIHGNLTAESYEEHVASDPRIDELRSKIVVVEEDRFSQDYIDDDKRSIANQVDVLLSDGTSLTECVEYPLGHRLRRQEGIPLLWEKFEKNMGTQFGADKVANAVELFKNDEMLLKMPVTEWISQFKV
jgi:2-methylcitrate dehydratase